MTRGRAVTGIVGATIILLSAFAHSLLGWPAIRAQLRQAGASPDLVRGVGIGWNFGGACMAAFGIILLAAFIAGLRGQPVPRLPARVISILYVVFGLGALVQTRDPFFLIFVVPGLLLAAASFGGTGIAAEAGRDATPAA